MKASKLSTSETVKQMKEVKTQSKNGGPEESPEQAAQSWRQSNKRQQRTVERRTEALKSEPGHRSGTWAKLKSFQAKAACL